MPDDTMPGPATIMRSRYYVEIDQVAFRKLRHAESELLIGWHSHLEGRLGGRGLVHAVQPTEDVYDVEYDGQFGPAIYYTVDADNDVPELHMAVRNIIHDQLETACRLVSDADIERPRSSTDKESP